MTNRARRARRHRRCRPSPRTWMLVAWESEDEPPEDVHAVVVECMRALDQRFADAVELDTTLQTFGGDGLDTT